jgi:hypothetical protein
MEKHKDVGLKSVSLVVIATLLSVPLLLSLAKPAYATSLQDKIIYTDGTGEIITINPDGSGRTDLGISGGDPQISPDGKKIAFDVLESGTHGKFDVYTANTDGSNITNITYDNPNALDISPRWSPDSTKLAYDCIRNGIRGACITNSDGSNTHMFTPDGITPLGAALPAQVLNPTWSPDGTKIAFINSYVFDYGDNGNQFFNNVAVANIDGTGFKQLTNNVDTNTHPAWSPDGNQIAWFVALPAVPGTSGTYEIKTIDANGLNENILFSTSNQFINESPSWSPDSSKIIFTTRDVGIDLGPYRLNSISTLGGNPQEIYNDPLQIYQPNWGRIQSPDSTPPSVSSLSWSANPLLQGQNTTLSVSAADEVGGSGVASVQYSIDGGTTQSMAYDSVSGTWRATFGSSLTANTYNITVTATDNAGNTSSGLTDVLAVYTTANGYVTGHAKTLPTASDTLPITRDTSNNPAKLILGFTNVTAPTSGNFDMDYSIKNKQNEFSLSSTTISWVVVQDANHASILGHGDLTTYVNGLKTVTQNVAVRYDITLGTNGAPDHVTVKIFNPSVDPNTGTPAYTMSDDVIANGSNLMIHP